MVVSSFEHKKQKKIDHPKWHGVFDLLGLPSGIIHNDPDDESMIVGINVVIAVMMMMIAFSLALAPVVDDVVVVIVVSSMIVIQYVVMTYPDTSTPPITKYVIRY